MTSFRINDGADSTTNRSVTLNNHCSTQPTHYMASELQSFAGAVWKSYSSAPHFTLSKGNGVKTVYFKVKDAHGESAVVSDTMALSQPTVTILAPDASASEPGTNAGRVRFTRTGDAGSGLSVKYSIGGTAVNRTDYKTLSGTVFIPAGILFKDAVVSPIDDSLREVEETVVVALAASTAYE